LIPPDVDRPVRWVLFYFISFYLRKREGALPLVWP
jgi:hypothetical protein